MLYSYRYTGNADPQGMNEALQGISSEVQQLLWQMQTEVVMEAIKELRLARSPPGSCSSPRRASSLEGLPHSEHSGPSGKLKYVDLLCIMNVCTFMHTHAPYMHM